MKTKFKVIEAVVIPGVGTGKPLWNIIYKYVNSKGKWADGSQWILADSEGEAENLIFNKIFNSGSE